MSQKPFSYVVHSRLKGALARTGVIHTPHGDIKTPAFVVVGTKASVKAMTPEQVRGTGAQAMLANAYHLYLQPGPDLIEKAGGLAKFTHWEGPTFTDSGGFQVLSLGSGFKKTLSMDVEGISADDVIAPRKERQAWVDTDGVNFKSYLDGSMHRFTPEHSVQIQHGIGADICFAFDELTSLMDTRAYQEESMRERTQPWAQRSLREMQRLRKNHPVRPYQAVFGVLQGANYEDLRRETATWMAEREFDGYGIGGAIEKQKLGEIVQWCNEILPEDRPKHMLGISEPDDMFAAVEHGVDTFDCVSPTRVGRNGAFYTFEGRKNIRGAMYKQDFTPLLADCLCYTCQNFTRAYVQHLFRAKELLANTLMSIHNEHFIVGLVDNMRASIEDGSFYAFRDSWLAQYYHGRK
ncbi:tRNA guanosine(34) transglycosylase Tgt [Candidatus Saccharibacteria bacterium]|nr:MAG: tRNA guanosine(34) transglycosylase Tgt [Candidatus Saccharibacteria bacterium]